MIYFEKVLEVAKDNTVDQYAGLEVEQFNMVKAYYSISFFQINRNVLKADLETGEKKELGDLEKFAGIDIEAYKKSPYLAFWNTNVEVLNLLEGESDSNRMGDKAKLNTLKRLSYLMIENSSDFSKNVNVEETKTFLKRFGNILNGITNEDSECKALKNEIKVDINKVVSTMGALYNVKLEGIK